MEQPCAPQHANSHKVTQRSVSYTHLDVYKRQLQMRLFSLKDVSDDIRPTSETYFTDEAVMEEVSLTR